MNNIRLLTLLILTVSFFNTKSQKNKHFTITPFERKVFIENKGQFINELPNIDNNFAYCIDNDIQVFFYKDKLVYRLIKVTSIAEKNELEELGESDEEKENKVRIEEQFINVEWINANEDVEIIPLYPDNATYSYSEISNGNPNTVFCKGYKKIIYKNIYNGIDLEYTFHDSSGFKYSFIVHPNADVQQIKMKYSMPIKVENNNIFINTILGKITESPPISFYKNNNEDKINTQFKLNDKTITFKTEDYNHNTSLIIDPIVITPTLGSPPYDNGVDNSGNIYVYGGPAGGFKVEKYTSAGTLLWSSSPTIDRSYYGDLLVEPSGNYYVCEGFVSAGAHTYKYAPSSALIWQSSSHPQFREHWRLALNCVTNKVIVAGGGTTTPTLNIAEIGVNSGSLINAKSVYSGSQSDVAGLAVDQTGKSYLKHSNPNIITFTDNANNALGNVSDGYNYSEIDIATPSYYPSIGFGGIANGHSMLAIGGGFLFSSDGQTLKKWDIATRTVIASVTIPGGVARMSSGLLADDCNNLFVGSQNGVYRYDFNLVQQEFHPTPGPVYDIAFSSTNADIIACGNNYITNLPFGRISCASIIKSVTIDSCYTNINSVTITPLTGTPPFTILWNDGDTNFTRTNLSPDTFTFVVKDASCVPSFIFDTIIIPPKLFVANISFDTACAFPAYSQFYGYAPTTSNSTNSWIWNFGDASPIDTLQNPTHIFQQAGTYNLQLIVNNSNGCSDTTYNTIRVHPNPVSSFSVNESCIYDSTQFIGTPTIQNLYNDSIYSFLWSFDSINFDSIHISLNYLYSDTGVHTATFHTFSNYGCSHDSTINIIVHAKPHANFYWDTICENAPPTSLYDASIAYTSDNISSWFWDFNNGVGNSSNQNPSFNFGSFGDFPVTLITTSSFGCKDTISDTIHVYQKPTANFSYNNDCVYNPALFNDLSTANEPGSTINAWNWNFGDGASDNVQNPSHLYANNGDYIVQLIVTSSVGCMDTIQDTIIRYPIPVALFSTQDICVYDSAQFTDLSSISTTVNFPSVNSPDTITNWLWNFGDGSPITAIYYPQNSNTSHLYSGQNPTSGQTYYVNLIVSSNHGCVDDTTLAINVHPQPVPDFIADTPCVNTPPTYFSDLSTVSFGDVVNAWIWNFNNNQGSSTLQNPSFNFGADGLFPVQLIVTSDFGCIDTVVKNVRVYEKPTAKFTVDTNAFCHPYCVNFIDSSSSNSTNIAAWFWDLGNGESSNAQSPSSCYTNESNTQVAYFTPTLIVENNFGCFDTITKNNLITVWPLPLSDFDAQPQPTDIYEPLVEFPNYSVGASSWLWHFGDGANDSINYSPQHVYADSGTYTVFLEVWNQYGCYDSIFKPVRINPDFAIFIPNAFTPDGLGENETFFFKGYGIVEEDFEFYIFDRWGELIYYTQKFEPWDGTYKGTPAKQEVYVYKFIVKDIFDVKHQYIGKVTLLR